MNFSGALFEELLDRQVFNHLRFELNRGYYDWSRNIRRIYSELFQYGERLAPARVSFGNEVFPEYLSSGGSFEQLSERNVELPEGFHSSSLLQLSLISKILHLRFLWKNNSKQINEQLKASVSDALGLLYEVDELLSEFRHQHEHQPLSKLPKLLASK
jgi:hypothetical protein